MNTSKYFSTYFESLGQKLNSIDTNQLEEAATMVWTAHQSRKKIIVVGNGGSAAMASHVAVDFTKAAGIRAIAFNDADLLTCFANDYGYAEWVVEALNAYADVGDVAILISSSGQSPNILRGSEQAREMGLSLACLSGFSEDNPLRGRGDVDLWVDSHSYNVVEMTHHIWLLSVVDHLIETAI